MISISIDDLPDNVVIYRYVDNDFIFIDFNKNAQKLDNISKESIIGKKLVDVFPSVKEFGLYDMLLEVQKDSKPKELDMKFYEDNRISGWRYNSLRKLDNGDILVVFKDLSDFKNLENETLRQKIQEDETQKKLAQQFDLLNNIINSVPIRIFWKDLDGVYMGANKLLIHDAQLDSLDDIIGKTDFDMPWAKTEAQSYRDDDIAVITSGIAKINFEETQTTDDGAQVTLLTSKVPMKDINGEIIGVLGTYSDITKMKQLEYDLAMQQEQLILQSRLAQMGEMISMIAHQWRQPLSSISITASNLVVKIELESFDLSSEKGQEEQNKYFLEKLTNINNYVHSLTQTIDDFRNFYRATKVSVSASLKNVINKALSIIEASLIKDNIKIIYNCHSNESIKIYDNEMMQVVLSLLRNAQDVFEEKNIQNPTIKIEINKRSFCISDNAGGIDKDLQNKIFDPYFTTKDERNGSGLGLYMARLIINDHHQGKLSVTNKDDGACFNVEL